MLGAEDIGRAVRKNAEDDVLTIALKQQIVYKWLANSSTSCSLLSAPAGSLRATLEPGSTWKSQDNPYVKIRRRGSQNLMKSATIKVEKVSGMR